MPTHQRIHNCLIMSIEYKIPRLLWENFESVLLAQSKRYIAELAKRLQVPEKDLLKRVLPSSDSLKVMMQDTQSDTNKCKAYVQQDKLTVFCKKPVAYGCDYCLFHRNKRMMVIEGTNPAEIQRIKDRHTIGPIWITKNNIIINSNGDVIGKYNRTTGKIKIFVISA
jgi:hypothetical protein